MSVKYSNCPNCGSNRTGKIFYGEPNTNYPFDENIRFGGCCLTSESPEYFCHTCNHEWNKQEILMKSHSKISRLTVSIGGYWSGTVTVDIDLNQRKLKWTYMQAGEESVYEKSLRIGTVEKLQELLYDIKLLNWKKEYVDLDILDGTQWSIEIRMNEKSKMINGSNAYPKDWDRFIREIKRISGKPLY